MASKTPLQSFYNSDENVIEIGVDEAGRGPMFGRVYAAAVVLPKHDETFDYSNIKDSKMFHSKKKINEVADYIKQNALYWHVSYADEKTIDKINILQATQQCMHESILNIKKRVTDPSKSFHLLIDGNYFNPMTQVNKQTNRLDVIPYTCVEGGDHKFYSIAAASILAKVSRDNYISDLCEKYPYLSERYCIDSNMGYGAKKHMDGIKEFGITQWHRRSFGICKQFQDADIKYESDA